MSYIKGFFILVFTFFTFSSIAQVNNFTLVNAIDNKSVSLSDYSSKKAIVIVFTSNYCPYSKLYEKRLNDFYAEYSGKGVQVLLINPNDPQSSKDDSVEEMAKRAREKGFSFPYLADKDQSVSNQFKASKTPEVFVLRPAGGGFKMVYSGAIDDNPQIETDVSRYYMKEAVDSVLSGQNPSNARVNPTGCIIKKN